MLAVESRLRRSARTAGEPEDQLSHSGDDGSRQGDHHPREVGQLRLSAERYALQEVLHAVQAVRGTAQQTGKYALILCSALAGVLLIVVDCDSDIDSDQYACSAASMSQCYCLIVQHGRTTNYIIL